MNNEAITETIERDPATGEWAAKPVAGLPSLQGGAGGGSGKTPLKQSLMPDLGNPATYTGELPLGGAVLAVDDFDDDDLDAFRVGQKPIMARINAARESLGAASRAGDADALAAAESELRDATKAKLDYWRTSANARVKGLKNGDGRFYALEPGESPLRLTPNVYKLLDALSDRAEIGYDFLGQR